MNTIFEKAAFLSASTHRDLLLYKNPFDQSVHVFTFIELNHKTVNTPYHEFTGKDITDELSKLNEHAFDANVFENNLEKKMTINIRTAHNDWLWLKATLQQF